MSNKEERFLIKIVLFACITLEIVFLLWYIDCADKKVSVILLKESECNL